MLNSFLFSLHATLLTNYITQGSTIGVPVPGAFDDGEPNVYPHGFPLIYSFTFAPPNTPPTYPNNVYAFVVDLVFWYAVAYSTYCLIGWVRLAITKDNSIPPPS